MGPRRCLRRRLLLFQRLDNLSSHAHLCHVTPAKALADIRGYARAGRIEFTDHAVMRARQRRVRIDEIVAALTLAHGCRREDSEKWRAQGRDRDGDLLEMVDVIEDGLLVVTLF